MEAIYKMKTLEKTLKEGIKLELPAGKRIVKNSELVFWNGIKLVKSYNKEHHYYNITADEHLISIGVDTRLGQESTSPITDLIEVSVWIESAPLN